MDLAKFGAELRRARESAGLSQEGLAYWVGASKTSVQAWESGRAIPRGDRLAQAILVLSAEPMDLLKPLMTVDRGRMIGQIGSAGDAAEAGVKALIEGLPEGNTPPPARKRGRRETPPPDAPTS